MTLLDTTTERRTGPGRRAGDKRRALCDWGNDLAGYVQAALELKTEVGAEMAFQCLVGDAMRVAKDLGITDASGRHE